MQYLLVITLFTLPLYAWPFSVFGISVNVLMLWLFVLWLAWGFFIWRTNRAEEFMHSIRSLPGIFRAGVILFVLAGIISLVVAGVSMPTVGQFLVLFVQPLGTFFIVRYSLTVFPQSGQYMRLGSYAFVALAGLYACIQYTTLVGLPMLYWGNHVEPKRALSFFLHPNFYALFVVPLLAFLIPDVLEKLRLVNRRRQSFVFIICWALGAVGLVFSLSRGGWLGLVCAALVYIFLSGKKWLWWQGVVAAVAIAYIALAIPSVRYRLTAPFLGERSSSSRVALWETGLNMVNKSPIVGKGLLGFSRNYENYKVDQTLEDHPTPHNMFIHTWVETGLLGLCSLFLIFGYALVRSLKNKTNSYVLGVGLAIIAIVSHGLVDTPYFKNDLAVMLWFLLAFI